MWAIFSLCLTVLILVLLIQSYCSLGPISSGKSCAGWHESNTERASTTPASPSLKTSLKSSRMTELLAMQAKEK